MPKTRVILFKQKKKKHNTSDAIAILDRMAGDSPELKRLTEEARVNAAVAQLIYDARQKAGLSQAELAERIGSKQTVISRLEDADYDGHSLTMIQCIAAALGKQVTIEFQDVSKNRSKTNNTRRLAPAHAGS
jgi:ribosome-binding protein aMBF1 (putative translation factor)